MKGVYTIGLLIVSNIFMTIAWYGHLKFKEMNWFNSLTLPAIVLISWGWPCLNILFRYRPIESGLMKMEDHLIYGN
jgi:uncharacterized protein (DUF486 family)